MKKLYSFSLICLSFLFMTTNSFAFLGDRANALTFTLGGGYDAFSSRRHADNVGVPYFAVGYDFDCHWGIEGLVGFFKTNFEKPFHYEKHTHGNLFIADGIYNFSSFYLFEPFIMAGIGVTRFSSNRTDANNQGNVNIGAGLKFNIDEVVALRVEARELYHLVGGKSDIFIDAGVTFFLDLGC